MAYEIIYSPEAVDHLQALPKNSQVLVLDQVDAQLMHQADLGFAQTKSLAAQPHCALGAALG